MTYEYVVFVESLEETGQAEAAPKNASQQYEV